MKIDERKNPDGSTTVGILSDTKEWVAPKEEKPKKKTTKKKEQK